jgi:hypothetical protein
MLEFEVKGQWLALVPVPAVAEYLAVGPIIFALCLNSTGHRQCAKVHDHPNGVPEDAIAPASSGFRGAHGFNLVPAKALQVMARQRFQPGATQSSSGLA